MLLKHFDISLLRIIVTQILRSLSQSQTNVRNTPKFN